MDRWSVQSEAFPWLERVAAEVLGLAVAIAAWRALEWPNVISRFSTSALAGLTVFAMTFVLLKKVSAPRRHPIPRFEIVDLEPVAAAILSPPAELLLRLEDRLGLQLAASDELLLDDPLVPADPESRVVQLFRSVPLPTAGEMQGRIERHLSARGAEAVAPDASGELYEALAALKNSLR